MTRALNPSAIVVRLRNEWEAFGQYLPETVDELIAATERTGPVVIPFPRTAPLDPPTEVIPLFPFCEEPRPGHRAGLLCGERRGHAPDDHVAYGYDGRVLDRWTADPPHPGGTA